MNVSGYYLLKAIIILSAFANFSFALDLNYSIQFFGLSGSNQINFDIYDNFNNDLIIENTAATDQTTFNFSAQLSARLYFRLLSSQDATQNKYFLVYNDFDADGLTIFDSRSEIFYITENVSDFEVLKLNPINWNYSIATFEVFMGNSETPSISSSSPPFVSITGPGDIVLAELTGTSKLNLDVSIEFRFGLEDQFITFTTWAAKRITTFIGISTVLIAQPASNSSSVAGTNIPVELITTFGTSVNSVSIKCADNISNPFKLSSNLNEATDVAIPGTFSGSCSLIAVNDINPIWKTSIPMIITPASLAISSPEPYSIIPAGNTVGVSVYSDSPGTFQVVLSCGETLTTQVNVPSGDATTPLYVPVNFYGNCYFNIVNDPPLNPVPVIITQRLSFSEPPSGSANPFVPLPILVKSDSASTTDSGTVQLSCSTGSPATIDPVVINVPASYPNNSNLAGTCTLTTLDFPSYYVPAAPVNILLVLIIEFVKVPVNFVQGIPFEFVVKSVNVASVTSTVDFDLICNGSSQTLSNVQFNTVQTFTPSFTFSALNGPYTCTLSNAEDPKINSILYSAPLLVPLDKAEQIELAKSFLIVDRFELD